MSFKQTVEQYFRSLVRENIEIPPPCMHRQIACIVNCLTCGVETGSYCGYCLSCHYTEPDDSRTCYYDISSNSYISN